MIQAPRRVLCSTIVVILLIGACAPAAAPAATSEAGAQNPALVELQQTVDALAAAQRAQSTPTPDLEKIQLQQTLDFLLAAQTAQAQSTPTPNLLQQTLDAFSATQVVQEAVQQDMQLQQTLDAFSATQDAQATQQQALFGPPPDEICRSVATGPSDPQTAPTPRSVHPGRGETYGGKTVTIQGANFPPNDEIVFCFGDFKATDVNCSSSESCTAKSPPNKEVEDVDVIAIVGEQRGILEAGFRYLDAPTVTSVEPNSGSTSGGTQVTIAGDGFTSSTVFYFGAGNPAKTQSCIFDECTVISPGFKSDEDIVVWVQASERGAVSQLDTSDETQQTFKYQAPGKYACDAYRVAPAGEGPFSPGQSFDIEWVVKNIGTLAWPAGQDVKFSSGSSGNMATVSVREIGRVINPNETATISLDARAPKHKGLHHMTWVVDGQGCALYVAIRVE